MTSPADPCNKTILCVDDEQGLLEFYRRVLAPPVYHGPRSLRGRFPRRGGRAVREPAEIPPCRRGTFRVLTASSGEQALEIVNEERNQGRRIAAGFFDMRMPGGLDGLETIQAIKAQDPDLMCAVVTTSTDRTVSKLSSIFKSPDEWIYFNKPFTEWELLQGANNLVSGWNLRRERERTLSQLEDSQHRLKALNDQLIQSYLHTVRAVVASLDARDHYTAGHSQRVACFATLIARRMGFSELEVQQLYDGFLLHDIGKIGLSDAILKKPGRLTQEEFEAMKLHTLMGAEILAPISSLSNIVNLVRHHHEWYDGRGYPDGLSGEAIPLGARIIAVADTFDAITSTRAYRRASNLETAREILLSCVRTQHDPEVTRAMLALLDEQTETIVRQIAPEMFEEDVPDALPETSEMRGAPGPLATAPAA